MTEIIETTAGVRCQMCGVLNWPTAISCMRCTATLDKRPASASTIYAPAAPMSFSQKVARFFEVVDFLLLPPAAFGLAFSMLLLGFAPWFPLGIAGWFIAGCFLLRGFFRHSRGRLDERQVSILWYATMGYNLVEMVAMLAMGVNGANAQLFLLSLWPMLVILLSASALHSESKRREAFQ